MTVSVQETVFNHVGNGVTTVFGFECKILSASDLRVIIDGTEVNSGFTVDGIGDQAGGSVTFTTAPAAGAVVRLERVITLERKTDYAQNGDFKASVVNPDFDRLWMALQQFLTLLGSTLDDSGRVLKLGFGDTDGAGAYRAKQNRIVDLADPISQQDAANRRWVEGEIGRLLADGAGDYVLALLAAATGASLVGGAGQVVSSIAGLRALSKTRPSTKAFVLGYYAAGDGGGGAYYLDALDTATADNGGSVIVASDGGRWKLADTRELYVEQFGAKGDGTTNDKAAVEAAAVAIPASGGILRFRARVYHSPSGFLFQRSNITLQGSVMPKVSSDLKQLEGGTILRGGFLVDGDNFSVRDLGGDHGITFSNTYKAGNGGDGIVIHKTNLNGILRNIHVENIVGLTRIGTYLDSAAAFHAVLLEGIDGGSARNVVGVGGWFGVVMKTSNWTFDGVTGRENDTVGVYVKSNSYAPAVNVVGANVVLIPGASRMHVGCLVQASDAELDNVAIDGVTMNGSGGQGAAVRIEAEATQPAVDVRIAGVTTRNTVAGASFRGPVYASYIEGVIDRPSSGTGLEVAANTVSGVPNDVAVNLRINVDTALATANHVNIASANSKVFLERAYVTTGYGTPGKLLVSANTQIGDVFGVLSCDRTQANLLNGWSTFVGGQSCGTQTRNGVTQGYGRIKFAGSSSDTFMTLPAGASPSGVTQIASAFALDGTTNKPVGVFVQVDGSGNCSIYPNRATYSANVSYVDLSSFRIAAQLPAAGSI